MKFESKYEVGQKLWEIKLRQVRDTEKCECCGQPIYHHEWCLDDCEQEIHGIGMHNNSIYYKVWRPCVYREQLSESDIGLFFFTSREAAIKGAEKMNKEKDDAKQ